MKLFYSPASPFVRKVLACAIIRGLEGGIERIPCNPHASTPDLLAANPLSKVPCLVTDDGLALFDSPVICEYLDSRGEALPLFPAHGAARWRALKLQAMADGIMDAAVAGRGEQLKPREAAREATLARFRAAIFRTLDALETDLPHRLVDIGSIAAACALGYLDFRYAADPWRPGRPKLTAWFGAFSQNAGLAETEPHE
ncbi:MAG: glutathione S-transferase N-terminal domain-containing protein [Acetobacteraceae bacterium]|nr:glutathione S-transferase N-terminal domain-containing protein [Acetobacteraceae bacterium]